MQTLSWPAAVVETIRSRYKEKRLPLARSAAKQPLLVFPELLEEMACSWGDRPYDLALIPGSEQESDPWSFLVRLRGDGHQGDS